MNRHEYWNRKAKAGRYVAFLLGHDDPLEPELLEVLDDDAWTLIAAHADEKPPTGGAAGECVAVIKQLYRERWLHRDAATAGHPADVFAAV